jgi:hypothetical protein
VLAVLGLTPDGTAKIRVVSGEGLLGAMVVPRPDPLSSRNEE